MELDPKLILLATGAVAPTKILIDAIVISLDLPGRMKILFAYLIGFLLILLYQGYTGEIADPSVSTMRLISGDLLAAITTMSGALLLTEAQKLAQTKKAERKKSDAH